MDETLKEINDLLNKIKLLNSSQPFHINIIDELSINENAHSRILRKLLTYQNEAGRYELLESLIQYISENHSKSFSNIIIKKPHITQEEQRIDLWVRDIDYAIIFENKIYDAVDQDAQLHRYIEINRNDRQDEQIYIVYLPSSDDCEPSIESWGGENEKKSFEERYVKLSFRDSVIVWLETRVIPNIRNKDVSLYTACIQYLDYLKGLFNLRKNTESMEKEIQDLLTTHLGLEGKSAKDKKNVLSTKINDINTLLNHFNVYLQEVNDEIYLEEKALMKKRIEDKYEEYKYIDRGYGGVILNFGGVDFCLYIGKDDRWYCQLETLDSQLAAEKQEELITPLRDMYIGDILNCGHSRGNRCIWKYCKYERDNALRTFDDVLADYQTHNEK